MMQDQLIMAKAYLHFASPQGSAHLVRELKLRIKEIERAISHSSGGSRVPGRYLFFTMLNGIVRPIMQMFDEIK